MLRSMGWRIAVLYTILILLTMAGLALYLSHLVREAHVADLQAQLAAGARLIADAMRPALAQRGPGEAFDGQARYYAGLLDARVTIIAADGTVLGESQEDRSEMDNHLYRPEVQQALAAGEGSSVRFSRTAGYEMMYAAASVTVEGQVVGFARVALPLRQVEAHVGRLRWTILSAALLVVLGAAILALVIAQRAVRPIRQLTEVAQRMAEGDLDAHILPVTQDEVGILTRAFNRMSERLRGIIHTLVEERGRLAGVLDNMADGVLITDGEGRVRLINPAAARLLGTDEEAALGRPFAQVTRDHRIIGLWRQCCDRNEEQVEAVEMGRRGPFLQVIATPLKDAGPQASLVILQDLTQVRRLETVRRDFISNISHELRTPLASLKALVDTLRDGALEDPPAARRFLDRMESEVDALAQMVQELLELARIESGQVPFRLAPVAVADVVLPPVERLRPQAQRAGLQLTIDLPPDLPAVLADVERVQQVVTNLVHNAIKFTPAGGSVTVRVSVAGSGQGDVAKGGQVEERLSPLVPQSPDLLVPSSPYLLVSVADTGVGISVDDLPRIFERFYKADRARSGGGTGLGLAIAKHIVQGHGGRIWAESSEGRGSTFCFSLPLAGAGGQGGRGAGEQRGGAGGG